jgi:tRNA pseudouridine55 synthase
MNGIFNIDKPEGMTSHDVVQAVRKKFHTSKVGHLGTLDPMATGVLPVTIGKATRIAQFIDGSPKEYDGELRFGFATDTYDREGTRTTEVTTDPPPEGDVLEAMRALTGSLGQVPPPFSAKKVGGVPSYKLARRNQAVQMAPARVEVERFDRLAFNPPLMTFHVVCSPGTYVRSLAHDVGIRLGCGAHLTALRRTRSGDFRIENATRLDELSGENLVPMDCLLTSMARIEVSAADEIKVAHGNQVRGEAPGDQVAQFARIFNKKGEFIAVASVENGWVRPRLVLTSITSDESGMLGCIL